MMLVTLSLFVTIVITTLNGNVWGGRADLRNIFLQTPPPGDFAIVTHTDYVVRQGFDQASLLIWQDHNNYIRLSTVYSGGRRWQVVRELGGRPFSEEIPNTIGDRVWMKISRRGRTYSCSVSVDGKVWWPVGPPLAADFSDVRVGLSAASPGGGRKADAAFDFFRINALSPRPDPVLGSPSAPQR